MKTMKRLGRKHEKNHEKTMKKQCSMYCPKSGFKLLREESDIDAILKFILQIALSKGKLDSIWIDEKAFHISNSRHTGM